VTPTFTAAQVAAFRLARQHLAADRAGRAATVPAPPPPTASRHGARTAGEALAGVVRDVAGMQAQVMSAAEMSIWTRRRSTTRDEIQAALWQTRDLVRTSAMRLTLHVVPSRDLAVYIAALKPMAAATLQRWHARSGASPGQVEAMVATIVESLRDDEPETQRALIARAKKRAGRGVRAWLDHAWSAVRPAVIEGAILYGPPRGAEATFVRTDAWLGAQPRLTVEDARRQLFRRFLSAFGPATPQDFAKWSGLKASEARAILAELAGDVIEVAVGDERGWMLRSDRAALAASRFDAETVRLLPAFDSLLLAHATKEHLVEPRSYKRVYRPQGWISPTVLQGGRIVGVWFQKAAGRATFLDVEIFGRATPALRDAIAAEADALGQFLGVRCTPRFKARGG
jgi:uncharacterized protein YcaQ